jgi:16S rRNA (uracil1498-N3)-methyltransferase
MRIPRIHLPDAQTTGQRLTLPEGQARHLFRVLRLSAGDPVEVFPGDGGHFRARLAEDGEAAVVLEAHEETGAAESPLTTVLWAGLSKGDKLEWVVQKATELGVSEIRPVHTARSVRRLDAKRAAKNLRRWQEIAAGACEQCGRDVVPAIATVTDLETALAEHARAQGGHGLVLAEGGEPDPPGPPPGTSLHLLIGPEGGLNDDELTRAEATGFRRAALGPRTLRTETAALGALAWAQTRFGDWSGSG